jgi:hypothetical protein
VAGDSAADDREEEQINVAKTIKADGTELSGAVATKRPTNELDQVTFDHPLMQVVQQQIGPFVVHRPDCEGEPCTCGLTAAVQSLKTREMLVKRYGTAD